MQIYLAGPIFTAAERAWNIQLATAFLCHSDEKIVLPQDFCEGLTDTQMIMAKCVSEVKSSHLMVVNADGTDVDSGTAFEAGIAYALNIRVIMYRTDFRAAGDSKFNVNLMLGHAGTFLYCQNDTPNDIVAKVLRLAGRTASRWVAP